MLPDDMVLSRMRRIANGAALAAVATFLLGGCWLAALDPRRDASDGIWVTNGTTLVVTVVVNGASTISVPPRTGDVLVPSADLPSLPWVVEAQTASGRILGSMTVREGDVAQGPDWAQGRFLRADLECGRVDVWVGAARPMGPRPDPEALESCAP